jgi:hypothetical protein
VPVVGGSPGWRRSFWFAPPRWYDTTKVRLAPIAAQELGADSMQPDLEVIQVDGQIRVIYSPLSMSAGWEQLPRAYNKGMRMRTR